jgi:hypothetical protein
MAAFLAILNLLSLPNEDVKVRNTGIAPSGSTIANKLNVSFKKYVRLNITVVTPETLLSF